MSSANVRTGIDAWVASTLPTSNFGTTKTLHVNGSGSPDDFAYLWFKNPAPKGSTILSAHLLVYGFGTFASSAVTLQRIASTWKDSKITYNNRPGVTGSTVTVTQSNTDGAEWDFDVTSLLQTVTDGAANYGFRLSTTATATRQFYALNSSVHRPVLVVSWVDPPDAPHTLSPSGGRAVSLTKPTLRFDYVDVSGSEALAAIQVQINHGSASFGSPTFDSGTVATADPELDLTATAYGGLSGGTTAYWRVRVQNAAGIWSAWSDAASFVKVAKSSLTIDNPAVAPNNFVSDPTPEIFWTFGGTQTAWRMWVALDNAPTDFLYDSGRQLGADASHTLPSKILTDQGATYRVVVYVYDNVDRESTPGDPVYVRVVRAFTFAEDPTPNPVTSLAAAQVAAGQPRVALTWNRSTAPDKFTIVRGGKVVDSDLDPADLFVSGTSYRYVDKDAFPHFTHTWKVQAVVNGKSSQGNPTVSLKYEVSAIWLVNPADDSLVPIRIIGSDGGASFDMPETAAVYAPVTAKKVVRITQGQRGLEGSVAGRITDFAGGSASSWTNYMANFKAAPDTELRLMIGAQTIPVIIGNVVIAPLAGGRADDRAVSFNFWSLAGPPS